MAGLPGGSLEPSQQTLPDPYAPLDSELLLQTGNLVAGTSYGLPQEQLQSPLDVEVQPAQLIDAGDLGALDLMMDGGAQGVPPLVVATGVDIFGNAGELTELGGSHETLFGGRSFSLGEEAEGLRVDYSPPEDVLIADSRAEPLPRSEPAPSDESWFAGLSESNKFRPASSLPLATENPTGRPHETSRLKAGPKPRAGGRSFNPFRQRSSVQRCQRCGGKLVLGHCLRCGADHCAHCGEVQQEGKCVNEQCRECRRDVCDACGSEGCDCGR